MSRVDFHQGSLPILSYRIWGIFRTSCHSQYWFCWVNALFLIRNYPSISFQCLLSLPVPFKSLFYKLVLAKLSFLKQNLHRGCWESVLLTASVFNNQTSQGNPTTEQLNYALFTGNVLLLVSFMCVFSLHYVSSISGW